MPTPQDEQEYTAALEKREATLARIKAIEADIAKLGFIPQNEQAHNRLIAERLRMLTQQRAIERDLGRTAGEVVAGHEVRQEAAGRLAQMREQRAADARAAAVVRETRQQDLRQRYGNRLGGMVAGAEAFGHSRIGGAAKGGILSAGLFMGGAARSGFQGTAEQNRLDYEWKLLNREFASAFKPVVEWMTWGVNRVRRFMEGMDSAGQNVVMVAGLLATAYGTIRMSQLAGGVVSGLMAMGGRGGAVAVGGGMLSRLMGGGTAVAAASGSGAMNMAALGTTSAIATRSGAAAGWGSRMAGWGSGIVPGGKALARRAGVFGTIAQLGMSSAGYGQTNAEETNPYSSTFAERNPEMAAKLGAMSNEEKIANWNATKESGRPNRLLAGLSTIGKSGRNIGAWALNQVPIGDRIKYMDEYSEHDQLKREMERQKLIDPTTGKGRRDVTPGQASYEEIGGSYRHAQLAFLGTNAVADEARGEREAGPFGNPVATPAERDAIFKRMLATLEEIKKNGDKKPEVK